MDILSQEHQELLSFVEKTKNQHFFELKEIKISLKNQYKQKKTSLMLRIQQLENENNFLDKEIIQKQELIVQLKNSSNEIFQVSLIYFNFFFFLSYNKNFRPTIKLKKWSIGLKGKWKKLNNLLKIYNKILYVK